MQQYDTTSSLVQNYGRFALRFTHGKGVYLYDGNDKPYLDFAAGIAVNSLGHSNHDITNIITAQADKLLHISNLYHITEQEILADKLISNSIFNHAFFCNSGTEGTEGSIKFARKWATEKYGHDWVHQHGKILTFHHSFHGRTLAALSAAGNEKYLYGFAPNHDGFLHCEFNNCDTFHQYINDDVFAIMLEPVQGEGGIIPMTEEFAQTIAEYHQTHDCLLLVDEVQCGIGRTGKFWGYEHYQLQPDILWAAKGLGNGFPIGVILATYDVAQHMVPSTHGSTFGGNPLACAVANYVVDTIDNDSFLNSIYEKSDYLEQNLQELLRHNYSIFQEERGIGLMRGLKCHDDILALDIVKLLHEEQLLTVPAADNIIRLLPPLIIDKNHIDEAIEKIYRVTKKASIHYSSGE